MERPKRNYNVGFAILIGAIGAYFFGMMFSGQLQVFFVGLPQGDLGIFRQTSAEQIITLPLQQETTDIFLDEAGTYRIITHHSGLRARNLVIHQQAGREEVPITVLNITKLAPYDTDLLQGQAIIEFSIDEPGEVQIEVKHLNLNKITPRITVFPDYTNQNRIILFGSTLIFFIISGSIIWYKHYRPLISKAERSQKRNKWNEFMDE